MTPAFQGEEKRRIPELSLCSGSPSACPGRVSSPEGPAVRSRGASPPSARQWWRGGQPLPGTGTAVHHPELSQPVHHGTRACLGCRARFFPPHFVLKCASSAREAAKMYLFFAKIEVLLPPARAGRRSAGGASCGAGCRVLLESGMELLSGACIWQ